MWWREGVLAQVGSHRHPGEVVIARARARVCVGDEEEEEEEEEGGQYCNWIVNQLASQPQTPPPSAVVAPRLCAMQRP